MEIVSLLAIHSSLFTFPSPFLYTAVLRQPRFFTFNYSLFTFNSSLSIRDFQILHGLALFVEESDAEIAQSRAVDDSAAEDVAAFLQCQAG